MTGSSGVEEASSTTFSILSGIITAAAVVILAGLGRFAPQVVPDTAGYLQIWGFPDMLAQPRAPFYGWLVAALDLGGDNHLIVPAFQIVVFAAASWLFVVQLRGCGLSDLASLSVGTALLFANALLMDSNTIHPELPAITCALLAFAGTVHLAGPRSRWWGWLLIGAGAGGAYVLRPSFLPLIVVLPILFVCLHAIRGDALRPARAMAIFLISAAPFVGIASLRMATVGDANIVSFGGYVMAGPATLMLDEAVVARLPEDIRPLATQLLSTRRDGENSGRFIGIPPNSSGVRLFHSAALAYFDVFARTVDDMLPLISATRGESESWVDFNARLMRFALAVVRAAPDRYASWVVGASTRMFGRSVVTNLPAALALLAVAIAWPWRLISKRQVGVMPVSRLDVPVMAICAVLWLVASGSLTVLLYAPETRYIETASLLVAPALIYWAALLFHTRKSR